MFQVYSWFDNLKVDHLVKTSLVHTCHGTFKIDSFNGKFFNRWLEMVFFAIDVGNLTHVLTDPKTQGQL